MSDPQGTFAWLVVNVRPTGHMSDDDAHGLPLYLSARGWTHDVLLAIRFARREDAQAVADVRNELWPHNNQLAVEEHGFAPRSQAAAGEERVAMPDATMHHEKHHPTPLDRAVQAYRTPLDRAVQAYREAYERIGALKEREATLNRELSGINREIEIVRVDLNKKAEMLLAEALK